MEDKETKYTNNKLTIETLPQAILEQIIQYLPPFERLRVGRVCRKWREASRGAWRDIDELYIIECMDDYYYYEFRSIQCLSGDVAIIDNKLKIFADELKIIHLLVSRVGKHIKKLNLRELRIGNRRAIVSIITKYCRNIEFMILPESCNAFVQQYLKLIEVNKKLCSIDCFASKEIIGALPLKDWKTLKLRYDHDESEDKVISLIENSASLEEFQALHCSPNIALAIRKCQQLRTLKFHHHRCSDCSIKFLYDIPMLNRLTSLEIAVQSHDAIVFKDLLKECSNLKWLSFRHFNEQILATTQEILLNRPRLETLKIGCDSMPDGFFIPFKKFKNLLFSGFGPPLGDLLEIIKSEHLESLGLGYEYDFTTDFCNDLMRIRGECGRTLVLTGAVNCREHLFEIFEGSNIQMGLDEEEAERFYFDFDSI